jgi:hypothetical protein
MEFKRMETNNQTSGNGLSDFSAQITKAVKRVASAVGEGSMVVQFVHEYFKEV